jgi:hypothetical protein
MHFCATLNAAPQSTEPAGAKSWFRRTKKETDMNAHAEALRAANQRAERERRTRLALIDAVTQVINEPHDTVEALKADVKKALEGNS